MRAAVLTRPGPVESHPLRLREADAPVPGPDEVRVRVDGRGFFEEATRVGLRTTIRPYAFDAVAQALIDLKHDAIRGAAVVRIGG